MPIDLTFQWTYLFLPLLGFLVGLLVTTFGGGGGFFYVPVLTILFGVPTQIAVATSLASIIPTTISGSISHYKENNVNIHIGLILGMGGVFGALLGTYISSQISPELLGRLFGILMIALVIPMTLSSKRRTRDTENSIYKGDITPEKGVLGSLFGLLSGTMAGMFGISGTPPVIAGLYILGLPADCVVGTSIFILLFNAVSGLFGHIAFGQFDLSLVVLLCSGSVVGAYLGPGLLGRIDSKNLERGFGPLFILVMLLMGLVMVFR
ncbi:MAG: sulfite exporter TauE/SafE family protein [Halobacteriota archaeon]|nr:sulfite exporter TauE/SafE family protein [Halobacteriota archaeon]